MKLIVNKSDLQRATTICAQVAPGRNDAAPIISCLALDAKADGSVALRATDFTVSVTVAVTAEVRESGDCALPAARLAAIVDGAADGSQIEIAVAEGDFFAVIRTGRSRFKLPILAASDMPIYRSETMRDGALSGTELTALLRFALPAVSTDEHRYYLLGPHLSVEGDHWTACATDGNRLHRRRLTAPAPEASEAIVPKASAAMIIKLFGGCSDLAVKFSESLLEVSNGADLRFITKLIDGNFPDVERVIPSSPGGGFTVGRKALLAAARRVAPFALTEKSDGAAICLRLAGGALYVAGGDHNGTFAEDIIDAAPIDGGLPGDFGCRVRLLCDCLDALAGDTVTFRHAGEGGPAVIASPDHADDLTLLMPFRLAYPSDVPTRQDDAPAEGTGAATA